jgi:hypothetical protein
MPVASGSARTRFTQIGLYSQRYGSFSGKTPAAVIPGDEVTTEAAYFARVMTAADAGFGRAVSTESTAFSRAVTGADTER